MKVSVIGTGYVGLVSGTCLAEKGHEVVCVDVDPCKVDMINRAEAPIHEPGLSELLKRNVGRRLRATTDLSAAVGQTELSLIAVGTPFDGDEIDLGQIRQASRQIGAALATKSDYHVVAVKSTVVPGTTETVVLPLLETASGKSAGMDFGVGMNPEFLREGEAVHDFMAPDRIVVGGIDERTRDALGRLYEVFPNADVVRTTARTAELIKYTANSLLATMISFSNEIANLASAVGGIDVVDVMKGVHLDKRLCPITATGQRIVPGFVTYLEAGCGFGGSCFPKDVKALIAHAKKVGRPMHLLQSVMAVNENQPSEILELLNRHFPSLDGRRASVLGLAFKPGTDDMRESPAIPVVRALLARGALVKAYDPIAQDNAKRLFGTEGITFCDSLQQAIDDSEVVILLTRWEEFNSLPELLKGMANQPVVIDGRRMLDRHSVAKYSGIGLSLQGTGMEPPGYINSHV